MPDVNDPLISVTEAAEKIGLNRSTLFRQIKAGAVRSYDGKVRLSELLADRAANIDLTRSGRRDGKLDELETAPARVERPAPLPSSHATASATPDATGDPDATGEDVVMVDGVAVSYAAARAMKETYLAKLKQLEFQTKSRELGSIAVMQARNADVAAVIRGRLLAVPGECSDVLSPEQVSFLRDKLYDAMEELSELGQFAEDYLASARGRDGDDVDGDEAPAEAEPRGMGRAVPPRRPEDQRRPR